MAEKQLPNTSSDSPRKDDSLTEGQKRDQAQHDDDRHVVKQPIYRTETQAAVAEDRGGDDDGDERELDRGEDVDRITGSNILRADPEVSLETVNSEDRDRVLKDREHEVGLTEEERREHVERARETRSVRESKEHRPGTKP